MRLNVEIRVISPKKEGVNYTGNAWVSQEVVIAWPDVRTNGEAIENLLTVRLRNEEQQKFEAMNLMAGDKVNMDLSFSTYRRESGYVDNNIRVSLV